MKKILFFASVVLAAFILAPDTQIKPPTVNVEKRDLQPAAGEKFDPSEVRQALSDKNPKAPVEYHMEDLLLKPAAGEKVESSEIREIRQALSELLALKEGVGSNEQIQEKKAALKAAVERGIKKDSKSVLELLLGFKQDSDTVVSMVETDVARSFIQRDPELAIVLLDQVPEVGRSMVLESIGSAWAESDLKAAFAWANQQTDYLIEDAILEGVISSLLKTDLEGAFASVQSLPPGDLQDRMISKFFQNAARGGQGALAIMQSLPAGRTKDLAAQGLSQGMSEDDPRAAWDLVSGIGDSDLRMRAEEKVLFQLQFWSRENPAAATQWMQSLPVAILKTCFRRVSADQWLKITPKQPSILPQESATPTFVPQLRKM